MRCGSTLSHLRQVVALTRSLDKPRRIKEAVAQSHFGENTARCGCAL